MLVKDWLTIPPGAGVGFLGKGLGGWITGNLLEPKTDRYHHLIIRDYVPEVDDYEFIESASIGLFGKGIRHGYLIEEYGGSDVEIYVVDCPEELARLAPLELIRYGKARYDFLLVVRLILQLPLIYPQILIGEKRLRKLRASDFKYTPDSSFNCLEAWWTAYASVGVSLSPPDEPCFPSSIKQSLDEGLIKLYWKGHLPRKISEGIVDF